MLSLISCRTAKTVATSTSYESTKQDSSYKLVDTSKSQVVHITEEQKNYSDTLSGSLQFTDEEIAVHASDSMESGGIKVKVEVEKTSTGIKTKITAVAKPVEVTSTTTTITTGQTGVTIEKKQAVEHTEADTRKNIRITGFPWKMIITIAAAGSLVFSIIFLLYKKQQNGHL